MMYIKSYLCMLVRKIEQCSKVFIMYIVYRT